MLKFGNINIGFFWLALLISISFHNLNLASASTNSEILINNDIVGIKIVAHPSQENNVATPNLVANKINLTPQNNHLLLNINQGELIKSSSLPTPKLQNSSLKNTVLQISQNNFESTESEQPKNNTGLKIIQIISLSFFLLLFVPFGIFYPFLLIYKKLFDRDQKELIKTSGNDKNQFYKPLITENYDFEKVEEKQVTISKLQIACSATDNRLRQKLAIINSNIELQSKQKIVELMRQNLGLLIEHQSWSHASCSSLTLPLDEIQTEFNSIICNEKNKLFNQELSLINNNKTRSGTNNYQSKTISGYVAFTLIICTSTPLSLLKQIYTKEQLTQELIKLSKLRKDHLIKFELLWNPEEEGEYISNDQLLMEYGDMIRLL